MSRDVKDMVNGIIYKFVIFSEIVIQIYCKDALLIYWINLLLKNGTVHQ